MFCLGEDTADWTCLLLKGVRILAKGDCTRADIGKKYGVIELHTDLFKSLLHEVKSEVRFARVEYRWLGNVIETVHASFVKSPALPTTALLSVLCARSHCRFLSVHLSSSVALEGFPFLRSILVLVLSTEVLFHGTLIDLGSVTYFVSSLDAPREGSSFTMLEDVVGLVPLHEGSSWTGDCGMEAIAGGFESDGVLSAEGQGRVEVAVGPRSDGWLDRLGRWMLYAEFGKRVMIVGRVGNDGLGDGFGSRVLGVKSRGRRREEEGGAHG